MTVDTSKLKDSVSEARYIKNFCGEYSFSVQDSTGSLPVFMTEVLEGYYNNYSIAKVAPSDYSEFG